MSEKGRLGCFFQLVIVVIAWVIMMFPFILEGIGAGGIILGIIGGILFGMFIAYIIAQKLIPKETEYDPDVRWVRINKDILGAITKAAYRRLAIANHPDKVQHLGETAHSEAENRFSKINEAYNQVKKARHC
jgi:preprotein translocase subunit Sec63